MSARRRNPPVRTRCSSCGRWCFAPRSFREDMRDGRIVGYDCMTCCDLEPSDLAFWGRSFGVAAMHPTTYRE